MEVIVTSRKELAELVRSVLREELTQLTLSGPTTLPKELLSLADCAALTGFAKSTIYSLVSRGQIPYAKKNGRLFFFRSAIEGWIADTAHKISALDIAEDRLLEHRRKRRR